MGATCKPADSDPGTFDGPSDPIGKNDGKDRLPPNSSGSFKALSASGVSKKTSVRVKETGDLGAKPRTLTVKPAQEQIQKMVKAHKQELLSVQELSEKELSTAREELAALKETHQRQMDALQEKLLRAGGSQLGASVAGGVPVPGGELPPRMTTDDGLASANEIKGTSHLKSELEYAEKEAKRWRKRHNKLLVAYNNLRVKSKGRQKKFDMENFRQVDKLRQTVEDLRFQVLYGDTKKDASIDELSQQRDGLRAQLEQMRCNDEKDALVLKRRMDNMKDKAVEEWVFSGGMEMI